MDSALTTLLRSSPFTLSPIAPLTLTRKATFHLPTSSPNSNFRISLKPSKTIRLGINAASNADYNPTPEKPIFQNLKSTATAIIFAATTASMFSKFQQYTAMGQTPQTLIQETETQEEDSPLPQFLQSNSEAIDALKSLLQKKLESGEDAESLKILERLVSAQPENTEWKFLMARLLIEMGQTQEARNVFEEILSNDPLSFEALFENALLMDRCGEGEDVIKRLEEALKIAEEEKKVKEARDVRLIIAQVQFLQKNVEDAMRSYEELRKEDPTDFRPYFCKGMIYSLLDRDSEAKEQFEKYRELSPKKFEVEGYLRTSLSRMKLFGTAEGN
ncbi:hypothetical protein RJ640_030820 [Escallonia rubra]|uniref:Uncharacterized protein n=1 Tax=Escallonia rubra TaxID=112253 RepID=A0AA88QPR4_9ASTE|nr:hypothetical protein RJ640_030820 [Escallonia rubra]